MDAVSRGGSSPSMALQPDSRAILTMSHELFHTSAPKGLQPGASGFCTVAATRGIPAALMEKVEALSGYRHLLSPLDPKNPVAYSHLRLSALGKSYHVLSRICAAGLDYSQRSNKFAHHVILEPNELPSAGPAWLLARPGFMETSWDGQIRLLPTGRVAPNGDAFPDVCRAWQSLAGDAGWAGVLAETFDQNTGRPAYLLLQPEVGALALIGEALALLSPESRWLVTFNTYFTGLHQGTPCAWRVVFAGSDEAKKAGRVPGVLLLDLTAPLGPAQGGPLVEEARMGRRAAPMNRRIVDSQKPLEKVRSADKSMPTTPAALAGSADLPPWESDTSLPPAPPSIPRQPQKIDPGIATSTAFEPPANRALQSKG